MNSSSEEDSCSTLSHSSHEGIPISGRSGEWIRLKNNELSSYELITFRCPYTLHKTEQFRFKNTLWTIGDIVSLKEQNSNKIVYAQIIELFQNYLCEKRAKVMWLAPSVNVGVTNESQKVHYNSFKPNAYIHVSLDKRLIPIQCLTFVMNVPNLFEYKKYIGTNYLVNTHIISHAERYAESDEDDGPKTKSKVRRLLNNKPNQ